MADAAEQARPWVESVADEHGAALVAGLALQISAEQFTPSLVEEIAAAQRHAEETARG